MSKLFFFSWFFTSFTFYVNFLHKQDRSIYPVDQEAVTSFRARKALFCSPASYVPEDFLKKPIGIKKGIGSVDFPITTHSPETSVYFNQGMAYLFNFEWVQAARSLYTALATDSTAAMAYWALSQAYDGLSDTTQSRIMARQSVNLSAGVPERERTFIQLQFALVQPANDSISAAAKRKQIIGLMEAANKKFPDDAQMWTFTAVTRALGDYVGPEGETEAQKARQAIDHYLNHAIQIMPGHFGVWHYLIHLHEATSEFTTALHYGELYTKAAPEIPHSWHMYAHDLMKTGRVAEAIEKFRFAFDMEGKKYSVEQMPAHYDWHHFHNMELLAYCYQYKGQFKKADAVFQQLDTLRAFSPEKEGRIRKGHPFFYLQNNQGEKALDLARPLINSKESATRFYGYFIEGLARVVQKRTPDAQASYAAVLHIVDSLKKADIQKGTRAADAEETYSFMYARADLINMGIGLLQNPYDTTMLKKMKSIQATLLKQTGPDPWIDALYFLQLLTQMSLNAGNLDLAESSAKNMILHDAGYPGAYWLLARISKKQGRQAEAEGYLQKARTGYADADPEFLKTVKL